MNKEQFFKAIDNVDDKMIDELMQEEVVQPETVKNRRGFNFRLFVPCAATLVLAFGLGAFALANNFALPSLSSGDTEAIEESLMPPEMSDNNILLPSETTDQTEETTYQTGESSDQTADQTEEAYEQTSETTEQASETDSQEDLETASQTEDADVVWEYIFPKFNGMVLGYFPKAVDVSQDTIDEIKMNIPNSQIQERTAVKDAVLNFEYVLPLYYAEVVPVQTEEDVAEYHEVYNFSDKYMISITSGGSCIGFCVVSKHDEVALYNAKGDKFNMKGVWLLDFTSISADIERMIQESVEEDGIAYMILRSDGRFYMIVDNIENRVINIITSTGIGTSGEELLKEIWEAKGFGPESVFETREAN